MKERVEKKNLTKWSTGGGPVEANLILLGSEVILWVYNISADYERVSRCLLFV